MKTIAFFNNKGGVGKTSLVYHLACMFADFGYRVIAADLDPQANLSGLFVSEDMLENIWETHKEKTIYGHVAPIIEGDTGAMVKAPAVLRARNDIGLLVGDLRLSKLEDELSSEWTKCMTRSNKRPLRSTASFAKQIAAVGKHFNVDLTLVDVGPNLGAINRSALIASDYVVIPLAPDLFSLQGLRNVGPTLQDWREDWMERVARKPDDLSFDLPAGDMRPIGYVVMRHTAILNRPVKAYLRWIKKIPAEYEKHVLLKAGRDRSVPIEADRNCLAHLKDYRSLMPLAQEVKKPMFALKPADGVVGVQQNAVQSCYKDFSDLAEKILKRIG
ncbi:MAG: AAA family ATPase [Alphaproteobacteria bacterium]|nr:AAA family ATPase [Gammaproteobacteria bacterium]MDA8030340.1 AAA family ATPase [Alphaproteobacteria bacterium]